RLPGHALDDQHALARQDLAGDRATRGQRIAMRRPATLLLRLSVPPFVSAPLPCGLPLRLDALSVCRPPAERVAEAVALARVDEGVAPATSPIVRLGVRRPIERLAAAPTARAEDVPEGIDLS